MALHPALEAFVPLEEVTAHGHRTLLARSRAKNFVAIEVLAQLPIPADVGTALSRTASSTAKLTHESIVQARALVLETDLAAVVTEFIPGVSLQRLLRFAAGRGVRLPDDVAFYILSRVLTALAYAHDEADMVHGSVSPSAVVVGWDGKTKLGDFAGWKMRSLVRPIAPVEDDDTFEILAPEVARGSERSKKSDLFGAALLALRLLTGRTPYARHREGKADLLLAMSEGKVSRLAKTRPDLPAPIIAALDRGLEADPEQRDVAARAMLDAVNGAFDAAKGEASTTAILARWKDPLQKSVTPWERRASRIDLENEDGAPPSREHEPQLAIAMPDDRPSTQALVSAEKADDSPWNKDKPDADEVALGPTDALQSLSRVGATVSDALTMPPPLPSFRITEPPLPTYGGPAVNLPRPIQKQPLFRGPFAAVIVFAVFVVLGIAAYVILTKLTAPAVPH